MFNGLAGGQWNLKKIAQIVALPHKYARISEESNI
jgi:hypothetical protein